LELSTGCDDGQSPLPRAVWIRAALADARSSAGLSAIPRGKVVLEHLRP
jgi:hypothetical protein